LPTVSLEKAIRKLISALFILLFAVLACNIQTATPTVVPIPGTKVNESSLTVTPSVGTAGTFSRNIDLSSAGISDWVIIQFIDVSAADGSTVSLGSVILKAH
jgi:hypothetical protein